MSKIGSSEATNHQESEQLSSNSQFNNNNMKLLEFNVDQYNTGNYDVILGNGEPVTIGAINPEKDFAIIGWLHNEAFAWRINGVHNPNSSDNSFRLYLTPKKTKLHITVTRGKDGVINVYGSTVKEPDVYRGSELLKRLTVEI